MGKRAEQSLAAAKLLAQQARGELKSEFVSLRERVRPDRLKQDAADTAEHYVEEAKQVTVATVKDHPVAFGASFLTTLALWYRKPLARQVEQRGPDTIDSIGGWLEQLRDWVAPEGWTPPTQRNRD